MPFNPSSTDMARAAKAMAQAAADACEYIGPSNAASADRLWQAISGMTVRELAVLHHFITVPKREG